MTQGLPELWDQLRHARAPSRQHLVAVGLMPDVPDDAIVRRVKNIVQRDRQFDHAKASAKMTTRYRNGADRLGAQFVGELREIVLFQLAQIGRRVDLIQKRR